MPERKRAKGRDRRAQIAELAARLMAEHGIRDFALAKRKAAERLQLTRAGQLPRNRDIERARYARRTLFMAERHQQRLEEMRHAAVRTMRLLRDFQPRLAGTVLEGTADEHSVVNLHVFADAPEAIALHLSEHDVPYELAERRFQTRAGNGPSLPAFRFMAADVPVELIVFPLRGRHQAPPSPVDGRPIRRAGLAAVERLLTN